jgi:hypothetical protein
LTFGGEKKFRRRLVVEPKTARNRKLGGLGKNGKLLKIIGKKARKLRRNATFLRKLLKKNAFWDKIE